MTRATWQEGYTTLLVLTTHGENPVRTGILTTEDTMTVGLQVGFDIEAMLDLHQVSELIRNLQKHRSTLINAGGGL